MDNFINSLADWFGDRDTKSSRTGEGKASGKSLRPGTKGGMSDEDKEFFKGCFQSLAQSTADVIKSLEQKHREFEESVEQRLGPLESEQSRVATALATVEAQIRNVKLDDANAKINKLEQQINELRELIRAGVPHNSNGSRNSDPDADPHLFVLGSLGRDLTQAECEAIGRDILKAVNIDQTHIVDYYAPYAFGSQVVIRFDDEVDLTRARAAVRNLRKQCEGAKYPVWLDIKKSRTSLLPGRKMRCYTDLLASTPGVQESLIIRCGATKTVYYQYRHQILGKLNRTTQNWEWGCYGIEQLSQKTRDDMDSQVASRLR